MSYPLLFGTLAVLIYTPAMFWQTYKIKALLHPGFFFCILWSFALLSCFVLSMFPEAESVIDGELLNELFSFILFTALSFLVMKNWGRQEISEHVASWDEAPYLKLFQFLTIITLALAVVDFFLRGAHFNALDARLAMVEQDTVMFYGEQSQSILQTLVGVAVSINAILCIIAGYVWGKQNKKWSLWFLLLPLVAGVINSLAVGGRLGVFWVVRYYFLGFALGGSYRFSKKQLKRAVWVGLLVFILFSIYSSWIYQQRAEGRSVESSWNPYPVLSSVTSLVDYFGSTFVGYQYRRNDFVSPELEWGVKSFSGLLFVTIPLGAYILPAGSIGNMLELDQYTQKEMFLELQAARAPHFSSISPMYMLLYDDFGYHGTIIVCFLLVVLTQYIFICWFRKPHRYLISIYFLLIAFCFWSNSFFDPFTTTANWKVLLLALLMIEAARYLWSSSDRFFHKEQSDVQNIQ